ncbi:MAG TPA: hypothetical protein VGN72_06360 [Tepidisphaeraceae bacterium]|jgi:hypothetical protein|nr:hypothetical protein [Tepidisphaeraceae bacterium]
MAVEGNPAQRNDPGIIDPGPMKLTPARKALMMEQLLIGLYLPPHNRADVEAAEPDL